MRVKCGLILTFIVTVVMLVGSLGYARSVYAQTCGGDCSVATCDPCYVTEGGVQVCSYCSACGGNGCESVTCPPGTYLSNNGCVQIGKTTDCPCGVKADGKCKGCARGCGWSSYSCGAAGPSSVVRSETCQPRTGQCAGVRLLNGQASGGCCDHDTNSDYCINEKIISYECCPVGTSNQCELIDRGTYSNYLHKSSTACEDSFDTWISSYRTSIYYSGPFRICDDMSHNGGECYWYGETYYSNTCHDVDQVCACKPLTQNITGTVYLDTNNQCSTANPWTAGGLSVELRGTGISGSVGSGGTYSVPAETAGTYNYLDLSGTPNGYICSTACLQGCPTKTSVVAPSVGNNFFLTPKREAWWQVIGGSIYAASNVRSELPSASLELIVPGLGGEIGALMRASGTVDTGEGSVSSLGYSARTTYRGRIANYDFFAAHMGVTPNTQNYFGTNVITKPSTTQEFYYLEPTGGNPAMITGMNVAAGESYVIFVDGDLRIAGDVTVENGGFLALIVNGSMRVSPAVTAVEGLYVVDGVMTTESNGSSDVSVAFGGSVVAWGGVTLGRDLVFDNIDTPAETFSYRVDLLTNMPDAMKVFALRWQEVVPGTIGQ